MYVCVCSRQRESMTFAWSQTMTEYCSAVCSLLLNVSNWLSVVLVFCWFFFTEITSLITTLLTNVPVLRCVLLFVTRFCQICASLSESCYIVAPYWFCFFSDDTLCKALTLFSSVVYPAMGWMPIHCEAEKRNQFFMCASFLILDRNWWIFSRTLRKVSATLQFLLLPVMLF